VAIVNAASGTAAKHEADDTRKALAAAFQEHGLNAEITMVSGAGIEASALRARERAQNGEIDAIAVGGGDGTIRTVSQILAGTKVPLAVLPLGTLNHFAKDIGIPLELAGAVAVIAGWSVQSIDLGEVNGESFINNSSIGLYPSMVADRERRREAHGMAKWSAMVLALLRALRRFPRHRLILDADDVAIARQTPCLFVGNNEYDMSFLSAGRKQLDAGRLFLYVAKPRTALAFLWFAIKAGLGFPVRERDMDLIEAREATIRGRARHVLVALDGEVRKMSMPLNYRIRPGALRVIVPAAA
jgi:diacylglycerol kinase family enzyme